MKKKSGSSLMIIAASLSLLLLGCNGTTPTTTEDTTPTVAVEKASSITLDKTTYAPGEDINVTFEIVEEISSDAWIGIIPSETAHGEEADGDAVDVDYQYLEGSTAGTKVFSAPSDAGNYDIRIYSGDLEGGKEVIYSSFQVEEDSQGSTATLEISKTTFAPGEEFEVKYTADSTCDVTAWIGIIPSDVEHGQETVNDENDIDYEYLGTGTTGTIKFTAPEEPGDYDLRLNNSDTLPDAKEITSVSFKVE